MSVADSVLVTGAGGFIGGAVVRRLSAQGRSVRASNRHPPITSLPSSHSICIDLGTDADWTPLLVQVDAVVHCAARVHVLRERAADPLAEFRRINVDGTLRLARQAADAGVRRFVFLSSIGVHGAQTTGTPFTADSPKDPQSAYAVAKRDAEAALWALATRTSLEVVIIRPPLVYGRGAPGNFARLEHAVANGWPLPLGAVRNLRSFVAVDNLVDLIVTCLDHRNAANQAFLVSDGIDVSTPEFVERLGSAMGTPARLLPVPVPLLRALARCVGRGDVVRQLCDSLRVDIAKTRDALGWSPVVAMDAALRKAAREITRPEHART